MLSIKDNLRETIRGGSPDRFVTQYEFMEIVVPIPGFKYPFTPGETIKDDWGITFTFPEGQIGAFPIHDDEHKLLKDITRWKEVVTVPSLEYTDEQWAPAVKIAESVDRNEKFVAPFAAPGIFEMTHHMMGMEDALMALYEEPEHMHDLIEMLADHELRRAKLIVDRLKPDALFHHDDWGGQISTFLSPEMFKEFFLEPYKRVYKFWKDNGVEVIVHHSDSYAATLVPFMIEMGIDIWQGVMNTNDIPALIEQYGDKISFMGGIHSSEVDVMDWKPEVCAEHVKKACLANGKMSYIPCLTQGGPYSSFPGVYDEVSKQINMLSKTLF